MDVKLPPSKGTFISTFNRKSELREPLEDVAQRGGAGRAGHELDLLSSPRDRGGCVVKGGQAGLDQQPGRAAGAPCLWRPLPSRLSETHIFIDEMM